MTHPIRAPTRGPTCDGYRFKRASRDLQAVPNLRAFIPVLRNPLEVEVDGRPEDVGDPRAIVLLRLQKPLGIFYQNQCAKRGAIYHVCASSFREKVI